MLTSSRVCTEDKALGLNPRTSSRDHCQSMPMLNNWASNYDHERVTNNWKNPQQSQTVTDANWTPIIEETDLRNLKVDIGNKDNFSHGHHQVHLTLKTPEPPSIIWPTVRKSPFRDAQQIRLRITAALPRYRAISSSRPRRVRHRLAVPASSWVLALKALRERIPLYGKWLPMGPTA